MENTTFVYAPQRGDRIFANGLKSSHMALVRYANGSAHVLGGIELVYSTANPGNHWRSELRAMLSGMARNIPLIAWDVCGEIHVKTPLRYAPKLSEYINSFAEALGRRICEKDAIHNAMAISAGGGKAVLQSPFGEIEIPATDARESVYVTTDTMHIWPSWANLVKRPDTPAWNIVDVECIQLSVMDALDLDPDSEVFAAIRGEYLETDVDLVSALREKEAYAESVKNTEFHSIGLYSVADSKTQEECLEYWDGMPSMNKALARKFAKHGVYPTWFMHSSKERIEKLDELMNAHGTIIARCPVWIAEITE